MDDISFYLGLIAGEGTVTVRSKHSDNSIYLAPYFQLRMSSVDGDTIERARECFNGIGTIKRRETETMSCEMVTWKVYKKEELVEMVDIIDEEAPDVWFQTEKGRNYQEWKDIVEIYSGGMTTPEERKEIAKITRDSLNNKAANSKSDSHWDELIEIFEEQMNREYNRCGEPKSNSDGVCRRVVSLPDDTCKDH